MRTIAQRLRPLPVALACVAAGALAAPATAAAVGTVSIADGTVVFNAAGGVANDVTVTSAPGSITIADSADTVTEGAPECSSNTPNSVTCNGAGAGEWEVGLGDLADVFAASGSLFGSVDGDTGDDQLTGGEGPERFSGGQGHDRVVGGGSDDIAVGFTLADDSDTIDLGSGEDSLLGVGPGTVADLGSGDDELLVIAIAAGGGGAVRGGAGVDDILGLFEAGLSSFTIDLTDGRLIDRQANGSAHSALEFEDVDGTLAGGDTIVGSDGPNRLRTGVPPIMLLQLGIPASVLPNGNDTVDPRAGSDNVDTGRGDDTISAADGYHDRIACGEGNDSVTADQLDVLDSCENVTVSQLPVAGAPPATPRDVAAPVCRFVKAARAATRKSFLKGYDAGFSCNESVTASARVLIATKRRKRLVALSKVGDVILAEATAAVGAGARRTLMLKPSGRLAAALPAKFATRVVIEARDAAGNRAVLTRTVKVSAPPKPRRRVRR